MAARSVSQARRQASPVMSVWREPEVVPESGARHVLDRSYTTSSRRRPVWSQTICVRTVPSPCPMQDAPA